MKRPPIQSDSHAKMLKGMLMAKPAKMKKKMGKMKEKC